MVLASVLASVLAGAGCRSADAPERRGAGPGAGVRAPEDALEVGDLVVVAEEATLYAAPRADSSSFAIALNRRIDLTSGHVMEVEAISAPKDGETFVKLVTHAPELGPACAGSFGVEEDYELHVYTRAAFLRTVLQGRHVLEFPGGARFELGAGTPVSGERGARSIHVGELKVKVELEGARLGRGFRPDAEGPAASPAGKSAGAAGEALASGRRVPWPKSAALRYGERELLRRGPTFSGAQAVTPGAGGVEVVFLNRCGRFVFRASQGEGPGGGSVEEALRPEVDADVEAATAGIERVSELGALAPGRWTVAADAPLRWLSGGEAGRTRRSVELGEGPLLRGTEGCFEAALGFNVCTDRAFLHEASLGSE